jgi:prepilin-type N-terminal cleavage/methylation domain-containing protein
VIVRFNRNALQGCTAWTAKVATPAFSLVELVIVIVIIGTIAAIAIPRVSNAGKAAALSALQANLTIIRKAIDDYAADHNGRTPNIKHNGDPDANGDNFVERLVETTDIDGKPQAGEPFGPYLRKWVTNPFNDLDDVRISDPPAGAGTHGWHYDPLTDEFSADDSSEHADL